MEHKELWCISLHVHFPQTSAFFESQAGLKFTVNHFNWCILTRAFQWCAACFIDSKICWDMSKMATHPTGVSFDILSIKRSDYRISCKEHDICGSVLSTDVVLHLRIMQCWIFLVEVDYCLIFLPPLSMIIDCLMLLLSLPSKEVIKGIHVMSMIFVALNWALMLSFACRRCSGEFFWLRLIVVCLILSPPFMHKAWERSWLVHQFYSCKGHEILCFCLEC